MDSEIFKTFNVNKIHKYMPPSEGTNLAANKIDEIKRRIELEFCQFVTHFCHPHPHIRCLVDRWRNSAKFSVVAAYHLGSFPPRVPVELPLGFDQSFQSSCNRQVYSHWSFLVDFYHWTQDWTDLRDWWMWRRCKNIGTLCLWRTGDI